MSSSAQGGEKICNRNERNSRPGRFSTRSVISAVQRVSLNLESSEEPIVARELCNVIVASLVALLGNWSFVVVIVVLRINSLVPVVSGVVGLEGDGGGCLGSRGGD